MNKYMTLLKSQDNAVDRNEELDQATLEDLWRQSSDDLFFAVRDRSAWNLVQPSQAA